MGAHCGLVEELLGVEASLDQTAGVIFEADGRVQDHITDHPILLQPQLVTDDTVLSGALSSP